MGSDINSKHSALPENSERFHKLELQLAQELKARQELEDRIRKVTAEYKKLEIELLRSRQHVDAALDNERAQIQTQLQREREKRLVERERLLIKDQFNETSLLLETMLDAIPDIIGVQDGHHRILRLNKAGYEFFGEDEGRISVTRCFELIGQTAPCEQCVTTHILNTYEPARIEKYIDSKGVWMDIRAYPILDMDGRVFRIVEHWRDITALKKGAASLVESEEKYRLLVENANEAIFIFQDDWFRYSNRKAKEMAHKLNLAGERKPLAGYVHHEDQNVVDPDHLLQRLNGGEEKAPPLVFRLVDIHSQWIWVELNTVNIIWQGRRATLNFLRDVTYNKTLERQFQEAQRMESIGTLAGGIAHDFNNLLMAIQGNVSLMYLDAADDHTLTEKMRNIEDCVESGSRLTKQLLGFARGGKYVVKPLDMNQIINDSAELFSRTRKAIKIHGNFNNSLWSVLGDSGQLEQVLLNLFLNAYQAMCKKGDIYLKTDNIVLDAHFVKPYGLSPGRYVKTAVTDTGLGMDEKTRQRIFEPFFTTQKPGRGTGLGLASVFGIIKNHRGIITVDSVPGEGATFSFYLPASDKSPTLESPLPETMLSGNETLMLVDDERHILEVGQLMLENLGYTILPTQSGREAIEIFSNSEKTISAVVIDMVMPDVGGEEVFKEIRSLVPDIKVLFISGHSFSLQQRALLKSGNCDFLQKPFNLRQLSTKIRRLLDN